MRSILPPDGGRVVVSQGTFTQRDVPGPVVLVMIEITGGPTFTIDPAVWTELVRKIRKAPSATYLGA